MARPSASGKLATRRTHKLLASSATTVLVLALATTAHAQNSQLEPTFGVIAEGQGFGSVSQTIQAGGDIDANTLAAECNGFIADAPDLVFDYSGEASVFIEAVSDADTTMVVEHPDGLIACNDDFNGLNPGMETPFAEPGRYAIWIGTFEPIQNNTYPDADIVLTEAADIAPPVMPSEDFMSNTAPTFGEIEVETGFGTQDFTLQAGGEVDAFAVNNMCAGFIAEAPDYQVTLSDQSGGPLDLSVQSEVDTTLVVVGPDATVYCNDDDVDLNPGLSVFNPMAGSYAVWVGTFEPIQDDFYPDATLTVSTEGSATAPSQPVTPAIPNNGAFDTTSAPTFGRVSLADLNAGHSMTLQAGGDVDAFTVNGACNGFIASVPDVMLDYSGGITPMTIAATSEMDTTMVVVAPDGAVYCNDDATDLNPAVTINQTPAGAYAIYVGTYAPIENDFYPDATLTISASQVGGGDQSDRAGMAPTFGRTDLAAGFGGHQIELQAGGDREAFELGANCAGFIAEAPDYVVGYAGGDALRIAATSEEDTTLAVITPTGQVLCNDDSNGLNPGLVVENAVVGDYAVWVGTFLTIENGVFPAALLEVAEISTTKTQPSGAITSTSLTAGFTPDPFTTVLAAGGHVDASTVDPACYGNIAASPDFVLSYTSGDWPLRVFVTSDTDTTLLVRLPSGEVMCNDDFDGLNPSIALPSPSSGQYEVFIGTYNPSAGNPEATLAVTELLDQKDLPPGAVTDTSVVAGLQRQDFELLAGGSFEAYSLLDPACGGWVANAPDFLAFVDDAGVDVEMTVRSAEDTTLAIRTPSGAFICDDDSGGDLNPMVLLADAEQGPYEVWLGTFSAAGMAPATFSVRDVNAGSGTAPNVPGGGKK